MSGPSPQHDENADSKHFLKTCKMAAHAKMGIYVKSIPYSKNWYQPLSAFGFFYKQHNEHMANERMAHLLRIAELSLIEWPTIFPFIGRPSYCQGDS